MKIILQAGKNASKLVAKILGFSRRQPPAPAVLDVNASLAELERMVRRLVGDKIELCLDLDPGAGNVFIDPGQLEQVLINLVINARDAMPGGGRLSLASAPVTLDEAGAGAHPGLLPGKYAAIRVQDNGTGMEPQVLAQIFEPFFTTKPAGEGTGLGLASVFGIVSQNKGAVWAESEPGRGSTFHLLLPQATTAASAEPERRPGRRFDGRTVLLIEDEPSIRQLLRAILESLGLEVHEAGDGTQGIDNGAGAAPSRPALHRRGPSRPLGHRGGRARARAAHRSQGDPQLGAGRKLFKARRPRPGESALHRQAELAQGDRGKDQRGAGLIRRP